MFGESAGGNAVTTLMATPSAEGLFARAIAQSSPPNAVYPAALAAEWAAEFVAIVREQSWGGHTGRDASDLRVLEETGAADLVTAALTLQVRTPDAYPGTFCLAPVVDGDLLPQHPLDAFRTGTAHRVPLIVGTNDREGSIFRGRIDILPRSPRRIRALFLDAPQSARDLMRQAHTALPTRKAAADFGGDYAFWYPSTRVADFHSRFAPVHCYRFDVAPRLLRAVGLDATHGVEMYALFDHVEADPRAERRRAWHEFLPLE